MCWCPKSWIKVLMWNVERGLGSPWVWFRGQLKHNFCSLKSWWFCHKQRWEGNGEFGSPGNDSAMGQSVSVSRKKIGHFWELASVVFMPVRMLLFFWITSMECEHMEQQIAIKSQALLFCFGKSACVYRVESDSRLSHFLIAWKV